MPLSVRHGLQPANDNLSIDELYRRYLALVGKPGGKPLGSPANGGGTPPGRQATSA